MEVVPERGGGMAGCDRDEDPEQQLVRLFEAACGIDFPTDDERNFRLALAKKLGLEFNLKEVRTATIEGPKTTAKPGK